MTQANLSHYRILDKLGEGGMGEVFRAEDTTLHRKVALKVLPAEISGSQWRLERFQREAEALAALNHPNIVTIFSVEEDEGTHFFTMELVEGESLNQLIPEGGLPLDKFFGLAIPLADALADAHESGIIHRDLKPANIMVDRKGRPKILDFGLAKLWQVELSQGLSQLSTQAMTRPGMILGTWAYMSPEQAEGTVTDHRADIFSFGIVLFEMATGQRPFKGGSTASLISSILKEAPRPLIELRGDLPGGLDLIVRRCLEKAASERYQSALDLQRALEELWQAVGPGSAGPMPAASQAPAGQADTPDGPGEKKPPSQVPRAILRLIKGPAGMMDSKFELHGDTVQVGRNETADLRVKHPTVSRDHSRFLVRADGSVWVEDLKSANGTWVNGKRVTSSPLKEGDRISLGSEVEFRVTGLGAETSPDPAEKASGTTPSGSRDSEGQRHVNGVPSSGSRKLFLRTRRSQSCSQIVIFDVKGRLDGTSYTQLGEAFDRAIDGGERLVVINVEQLEFVDHAGLGVLVKAASVIDRVRGQLRLVGLSQRLQHTFTLSRLDSVFRGRIKTDEKEAVRDLRRYLPKGSRDKA